LAAPTAPTRAGYTFEGWFRGKAGLTWLEPAATTFPLNASTNDKFYAYWEPINSNTITYASGETYFTSIGASVGARLNPMTYQYSHEIGIMNSLSTPLFSTEVDWDSAISKGIADFVGDFSKIELRDFSVDALDFSYLLIGAASYPKDSEGRDFLVNGKYDRTVASTTQRLEWTFEIRNDVFFENGTQVTSAVFKDSLAQYLDPLQNNRRATIYFDRGGDFNDTGYPILNAEAYRFQDPLAGPIQSFDEKNVGFEIIDDFTFTVKFWREVAQSEAVGFGNIVLVEPTIFRNSLNQGVNSTYGTPSNPFVSYGGYLIKSWSDNQRIVLNKNFDYIRKDLVTYKSIVYEYTESNAQDVQLFKSGLLSATGLLGETFSEFAENPAVKFSFEGYPQYIIVNFAPSMLEDGAHIKSPVTSDPRFRQALFFAINRETYNSTIYSPNLPSVLPVPNDTKVYLEDPLYYSESPNHFQNLEDFEIPELSNGFLPDRARSLFNQVLADNPGIELPIRLKMPAIDDPDERRFVEFMKNELEKVFNVENQPERLVIDLDFMDIDAYTVVQENWDFDLTLINLGFGSSTMVQMQYASIGFLVAALFGRTFGMNMPFGVDSDGEEIDLRTDPESFYNEKVTIDLTTTLDYLEGLLEEDPDYFATRPAFQTIYNQLVANTETGKPRGIYNETLLTLAVYLRVQRNVGPYAGTRSEPFPGATQEVWKIVAAMEKVFFEQMPVIPTSTLASAVIYADNVEILWPFYSVTFGWGSSRYRFLSTDSDFSEGLYNSFEVAYLAGLSA
jgi:oligopeptide transport system substrate-binding protein